MSGRDKSRSKLSFTEKSIIISTLAFVVILFVGGIIYWSTSSSTLRTIDNNVGVMIPVSDVQVCYHNCQDKCRSYPSAASVEQEGWSYHNPPPPHYVKPIYTYEDCFERCAGTGPSEPTVDFECANSGYSIPTAIRFGRARRDNPNAPQRMFVAQQHGIITMSKQNDDKGGYQKVIVNLTQAILGTINQNGPNAQGGLMGFELHPRFSENGKFFVWYSVPRPDGNNATNTPNCSTNGGYGASGPSNNRRNFGADRTYNPDVYANLMLLDMWYLESGKYEAVQLSTILTHKHFFTTHFSWDSLRFEENGKLLVTVPDGGCFYDQYGVGQNRNFIAGKIIVINVNHNSTIVPLFWNPNETAPPLPPYYGLFNCTIPVATWDELKDACPYNYMAYGIYASGVMDGGHIYVDRHNGVVNRYFNDDTMNSQVGLYRFEYESNFGWVTWDAQLCTCVLGDYFMDPVCDFNQSIPACLSKQTSLTGQFTKPIVALNQLVDDVVTQVGGVVYRGTDLPCNLIGRYIWGDFSKWDVFNDEYTGQFRLWTTNPSSDQTLQATAHEKIRLGRGLKTWVNYLYSFGYDSETGRMYLGTSTTGYALLNTTDGTPTTGGEVYLVTF
jgi:hypothetical protein